MSGDRLSPAAALIRTVAEWREKGLDRAGIAAEAAAMVEGLSEQQQESMIDGALALLDGLYARAYSGMVRRQKHETVELTTPDGQVIDVDAGVAPLVEALWRNGWNTFNSCENDAGWVWVEMSGGDVEKFLRLVARKASADVAWGAREACSRRGHPYLLADREVWDLSASAHDLNEDYDEETESIVRLGPPDVAVTVGVRFPQHHLEEVTAIVAGTRRAKQRAKANIRSL